MVEIPLNAVHWHGVTPDEEFVHIGISARVHLLSRFLETQKHPKGSCRLS
ncbi:hypothetical protein [Thermotoga sp.]|nr:hypothetical protein [Thermotoga sp.]MCD6552072.1 hypothetical protein [Thermotoga sp.]